MAAVGLFPAAGAVVLAGREGATTLRLAGLTPASEWLKFGLPGTVGFCAAFSCWPGERIPGLTPASSLSTTKSWF